MNYAFKMMAVVMAVGVLVLQGCMTTVSNKYLEMVQDKGIWTDKVICKNSKYSNATQYIFTTEAKRRGLDCGVNRPLANTIDSTVCSNATSTSGNTKIWNRKNYNFVGEANYRGLDCGVQGDKKTVIASKPKTKTYTQPKSIISSAEFDASKRLAETERQKRKELERKLASLQSKQKQEQQLIQIQEYHY